MPPTTTTERVLILLFFAGIFTTAGLLFLKLMDHRGIAWFWVFLPIGISAAMVILAILFVLLAQRYFSHEIHQVYLENEELFTTINEN
jgi:hypothetical protein